MRTTQPARYQAAVLAEICEEVYSIEIVKPLAEGARKRLAELGYKNVTIRHGDDYQKLIVIEKDEEGKVRRRPNIAVMFVPMTGEAQERRE